MTDLFHSLGPEAVFSAKHHWTPPRTVQLTKRVREGWGLSLQGNSPVVVQRVEQHSMAKVGSGVEKWQGLQLCVDCSDQ